MDPRFIPSTDPVASLAALANGIRVASLALAAGSPSRGSVRLGARRAFVAGSGLVNVVEEALTRIMPPSRPMRGVGGLLVGGAASSGLSPAGREAVEEGAASDGASVQETPEGCSSAQAVSRAGSCSSLGLTFAEEAGVPTFSRLARALKRGSALGRFPRESERPAC